jgi:hypothetical protein
MERSVCDECDGEPVEAEGEAPKVHWYLTVTVADKTVCCAFQLVLLLVAFLFLQSKADPHTHTHHRPETHKNGMLALSVFFFPSLTT